MLEELISTCLPFFINILEIMGIVIVLIGSFNAFYLYIKSFFKGSNTVIKSKLANTLATALEFKLGSEILKTVLIKSIDELWIIAAVSLLRGFMAFIIYWEMKNEE